MAKIKKVNTEQALFTDIARLIDESKSYVAYTVNTTLTILYWKIGKRINDEVLNNIRAEYGNKLWFLCHDNWAMNIVVVSLIKISAE